MKYFKLFNLILILALLTGCGSQVITTKPTDVNLDSYQTFAYLPNAEIKTKATNYSTADLNTMVVETINSNLMDENYKLDRDNPDLLVLVSYKTDIEKETTTDPVYARYPYTPGVNTISPYYNNYYYNGWNTTSRVVGYDTDTYRYKEGTVIVDLIDRKTSKTVWKGVTTESVSGQRNMEAITELVNAIFTEFPKN